MKRNTTGSLLANLTAPQVGAVVWTPTERGPRRGVISRITNIDGRGLANTYCDVTVGATVYHCGIDYLFDHRPTCTQVTDSYGVCTVWQ